MLYENQQRIRVDIPYDPALIRKIRTVSGARWSPQNRCWLMPKTPDAWAQLKAIFGEIQIVAAPETEPPPETPQHKRLFVREAKGKKDRCTILSDKAWVLLHEYIDVYRPIEWLFEGTAGGKYGERSVQAIFTQAKEKSKINPAATVHTLRYAPSGKRRRPALHSGTAGHESSKTTEIYTHNLSR